jgi:hypothetical protein
MAYANRDQSGYLQLLTARMTHKITYDLLNGRSTEHLANAPFDFPVHWALVAPLTDLINEASIAGHQTKLISGRNPTQGLVFR